MTNQTLTAYFTHFDLSLYGDVVGGDGGRSEDGKYGAIVGW